MDDGKRMDYGYSFATNSFTEQEDEHLCVVLKSKYNLTATKNIGGYFVNNPTLPQYNIYIHAHSV